MARKQKTKRTKSRKKQTERNIVTDSKIREEIVLIWDFAAFWEKF